MNGEDVEVPERLSLKKRVTSLFSKPDEKTSSESQRNLPEGEAQQRYNTCLEILDAIKEKEDVGSSMSGLSIDIRLTQSLRHQLSSDFLNHLIDKGNGNQEEQEKEGDNKVKGNENKEDPKITIALSSEPGNYNLYVNGAGNKSDKRIVFTPLLEEYQFLLTYQSKNGTGDEDGWKPIKDFRGMDDVSILIHTLEDKKLNTFQLKQTKNNK